MVLLLASAVRMGARLAVRRLLVPVLRGGSVAMIRVLVAAARNIRSATGLKVVDKN
jgi:hypothetical protein